MPTMTKSKQTFKYMGCYIAQLLLPLLLSLMTPTATLALGCDEPFVRPYYVARSSICAAGEYVEDSYAPGSRIRCEEMELDHLVSLKQAWESGICGGDLKRFANDPLNLKPTYWRTNRTKGMMSPILFSEQLDGEVADSVRRDALVVMQKYGILSRSELFDRKYATHFLRLSTVSIPFSNLIKRSGQYTIREIGEKTFILAGKRIVGTLTVVGGVYTAAEVSTWSYRHLFIPNRDDASKDRAAMFEEILNEFE